MNGITLTASMRTNLQSLKTIALQMNKTQNILSTGKKVNSAIDNASSYYQARALTNRASDLNNLLDSMGQGIQTIQAATEGLTSAMSFLEQAKAVANQALASDFELKNNENKTEDVGEENVVYRMRTLGKTYQDYLDEGYQEITATMSASEIQDLIKNNGKVIFKEDITLTEGISINANAAEIIGNGKTLTVNADDTAAITVKGKGANAYIEGLKIVANGTNAIGVKATEGGTITIDKLDNVTATGEGAKQYYYRNEDLFNGEKNTQAIYNQTNATSVNKAMQYVPVGVSNSDDDFGQGEWYIGAIGEWTDLYGYDYADVVNDLGFDGSVNPMGVDNYNTVTKSDNVIKINEAFTAIGSDAQIFSQGQYWTSTENASNPQWFVNIYLGQRSYTYKHKESEKNLRLFNDVKNCYNPAEKECPQIGDIMYADKTWSSADDYATNKAAGKTAVGVVFDVDTINGDVKIVALKDVANNIAFGSNGENFTGVTDYTSTKELKNTGEIIVTYTDTPPLAENNGNENITEPDNGGSDNNDNISDDDMIVVGATSLSEQFNDILSEFNTLIKDTSYQGVNLLKGADLTLTFNESCSNKFTVSGRDMSAENLGLITRDWKTKADIETSIKELTSAIDAIREFQTELGNNYSIIQTRQNFTEALTDVLETGADNLVLADMNETSAEYLMLQTRQQLATNSLSLAAQSAQSILTLF